MFRNYRDYLALGLIVYFVMNYIVSIVIAVVLFIRGRNYTNKIISNRTKFMIMNDIGMLIALILITFTHEWNEYFDFSNKGTMRSVINMIMVIFAGLLFQWRASRRSYLKIKINIYMITIEEAKDVVCMALNKRNYKYELNDGEFTKNFCGKNPSFNINIDQDQIKFIGLENTLENKEMINEILEFTISRIKNYDRKELIKQLCLITFINLILIFFTSARFFDY